MNNSVDYVNDLVERLSHLKLKSESDIAGIVLIAMRFMTSFRELNGEDKKRIVIEALKVCVNKQTMDDEIKANLILLIDVIVPNLIESLYSVSVQKIKFKNKCSCI